MNLFTPERYSKSSCAATRTNGFISLAAISGILVDHFLFLG
jgi:hypothetical protein